jgi:ribosomal protein L23
VRVASVRIVNRKGKPILRYGRVASHRPATRKAYVKLAPGSKTLEFFEGV